MIDNARHSTRVALTAALLALGFSARALGAEVVVAIRYDSEEYLELAERLESELRSAGYTVDVRSPAEPSPCDQNAGQDVPVAEGTTVWIRLKAHPDEADTVVASICYLGTLPFIQRASVHAPSGETRELALATAEAVNGLRSKLPPWASTEHPRGDAAQGDDAGASPGPTAASLDDEPAPKSLVNSVLVGTAVAWNVPDFPVAPGVVGRATLGVVPSVGIVIDAFIPTTGRELESPEVTATLRSTWLRVGPRVSGALGDFELSAAALAGPAITWVTGDARPPRVGTTDMTPGAMLSLAGYVEYPRRASIFACVSAAASALLPGVKVDLGEGTEAPRGSWPLEASIGFGARWGDR